MAVFDWNNIYSQYCEKCMRNSIPNIKCNKTKLTIVMFNLLEYDLPPIIKTLEDKRISLSEIVLVSEELTEVNLSMKRKEISISSEMKPLFGALSHFISHCFTLHTFKIQGLKIPLDILERLIEDIVISPNLHTLEIQDCPFNEESIEVLCQALYDSLNLQNLSLIRCDLTPKCAPFLAKLIKEQDNTNKLYFKRYSYFKDSKKRCGLGNLILDKNHNLKDEGIRIILEAARPSESLEKISFKKCGWTELTTALLVNITDSFDVPPIKTKIELKEDQKTYNYSVLDLSYQKSTESLLSNETDEKNSGDEENSKELSEKKKSSKKQKKISRKIPSRKIKTKNNNYKHIKAKVPTRDIIPRFCGALQIKK